MTPSRHATTTGGLVCSSDYRASQAGIDMLNAGGTCIDAALAAAAVLNVVEPFNSHLGGDAFMLYWSAADKKVTAINGSGNAPACARLEDFAGGIPLRGIRAATVPGQVHAWLTAHSRWGKLPLATLFEAAICCAEEGFEASPMLASALEQTRDCHDQPNFRRQFFADGQPPKAGDTLRQPNIAKALRLIARGGIDAYYRGPIAQALVDLSRSQGGWFEAQDLAGHRTSVEEALSYNYDGWTVLEQPAPSQGVIVLQCLAIARQLGLANLAFDDPQRTHLMIETIKAAYADRFRWWADPVFSRLPIQSLLSDNYAAQRAGLVDPNCARSYDPGNPAAGRDTTYFCVADAAGNALSYIQSVFHGFGCGVVEPTFGVVLNNRMNGFNTQEGHPNAVQAGKRPVHTLNTWMVLKDGEPAFVGGTPGGPSQVQWNFQTLLSLLNHGMSLERTVTTPRWSWQDGLAVSIERDFGEGMLSHLQARGHNLQIVPARSAGRVQLIRIDPASEIKEGCGDPRIDSAVLATKR